MSLNFLKVYTKYINLLFYYTYVGKNGIIYIEVFHMKHGRGYVYDLYFHIVWCVKYRHKVLVGSVKDDLIDIIKNICMNNNYELVEINTDLDHIHLLIGLSPQDSIPVVMKTLKGVSARLLNSKHKDELSKVLYGGHIWSPSYYIATTSDNVMENIKQYIIHQGDVDKRKG